MLILEELAFAQARGAPILAELSGFGQSADAFHITAPAPEGRGAQIAMRAALEDARVAPESIDYVNAHGTSTPANDRNETAALKAVFGERAREFVASSTKSMTGHMLGAAGAVETAVCALACSRGVMPPTINYTEPDPECDLNYATDGPIEAPVETAISNSFGFGGHNVCLVTQKWTG